MGKVIYAEKIFENIEDYKSGIQLDKIMKRLFTLTNKKPIIDFLNAIYHDNLSDNSKITYLNKEVTEENPFKDAVFQSLYSDLRILVVDGRRTFKYDIEFQTVEDKSIALRLFRYTINLEAQSLQQASNKMVIELPKPFVIILEKSTNVPKYYELIIRLDTQELKYRCKTLKYWEYDINRLYEEQMYLLFPIKIIDVRNKIRRVKKSGKLNKNNPLIKEIHDDILKISKEILDLTNTVFSEGLITTTEYEEFGIIIENLVSYLNKEVNNVMNEIDKEVKDLVTTFFNPKVYEEGIEKGQYIVIEKQLIKKFGNAANEYIKRLPKTDTEKLLLIAESILDIERIEDLDKYIN